MNDCSFSSTADPAAAALPSALLNAFEYLYLPAGLTLTMSVELELESSDYGACRFGLDGQTIAFRVAKTTPTKVGQFVTMWKRPLSTGPIVPLDLHEGIAYVVIGVSDATHSGQFVFNRHLLASAGAMSVHGNGGKRAIRVYPPWTQPIAKEAIRTQQWQLRYFLPIHPTAQINAVDIRRLFDFV